MGSNLCLDFTFNPFCRANELECEAAAQITKRIDDFLDLEVMSQTHAELYQVSNNSFKSVSEPWVSSDFFPIGGVKTYCLLKNTMKHYFSLINLRTYYFWPEAYGLNSY